MRIPLSGCEYKDFMFYKKKFAVYQKRFCIRCDKRISHLGTSEYCTMKCFREDLKKYTIVDTFRNERFELSNAQERSL